MPDRPTPGALEQRSAPADAALALEGRRLRGLIPYGLESRDLGGWREIIDPGALEGARLEDLVATVDHAGVPLGRHPGTLVLEDRADGLHWSVELAESRSDVRDAVHRGDPRASSWRMIVARDRWDGEVRHVERIAELRDVAVVTTPAYPRALAELPHTPMPRSLPCPTPRPTLPARRSAPSPNAGPPARCASRTAPPRVTGRWRAASLRRSARCRAVSRAR